jgi:hypothetical protein
MKKLLGCLLGAGLFALLLVINLRVCRAAGSAQENSTQEKFADDGSTALTIYNQNFFVAREHVPLDLRSGVNEAQYTGVAAHLEPDSVILRDPNGRALQILEQNYRNDPVSPEMLLSFYEGKSIDFVVGRTNGKEDLLKGKIIRSGYSHPTYINGYPQQASTQPIVEVDGVLRFGLPGQPIFPALSVGAILKPTLSWLLQTNDPGKFNAEISYVSGGMNWQSDYNIVVRDGVDSRSHTDLLDMIGWITMCNQSGKTFEDARIKLLAGDVSKIQNAPVPMKAYLAEDRAMNAAMAAPVQEKSFDEFHLYTLQRPTTLHDEETKQVEFVRSTGVHSQRLFIYDGARTSDYGYYNPDQIRQDVNYGTASNPKVWVMEEFKNSENNHLGIPLPKGKLRFYRRDTDGHLEFVGENTIDHTPKDETIRVYTGNAFDVVGERKRTNYHVDSNQRWMDESFEIRIRNHKKDAVEVRAVEHLYRWTNWKLMEQSSSFHKKDAQTIEFPVTIAANGEQVITYTVHYSW